MTRTLPFLASFLILSLLAIPAQGQSASQETRPERVKLTKPEKRRQAIERKLGRADYFFRLLRDPQTNSIPARIRQRELTYARSLPTIESASGKAGTAEATIAWQEAGPIDVGGRTRALAVDVTNSNVILAGGASGGIWKSTDNGANWTLKSDPSQHPSITWIAQDPRAGQTNVWYAASGELLGSASDQGRRATYFGGGLFKSVNGGETWTQIQDAGSSVAYDSEFDFVSKIMVHPTTGTILLASNNFGLYRSTDAGQSFTRVFGSINDHKWIDFDIASNGTIVAVLSQGNNFPSQAASGVYRSTDDGQNWTAITPSTFPLTQDRSVLAIAPSNPDVAYVFTWTGTGQSSSEDVRFHKITVSSGASEDRSSNLPNFGGNVGFVDTQGGYNMTIAVKPDDENFVLFGATNLFRSRNGFGTAATDLTEHWIGGYATANDISQYANQHPDQHALVFDPADSNKLWSGHDGGLSLIDDITTTADELPWQSKNNGYNITQFYTVAIHDGANDTRLVGGTQDNGSPFFQLNGQTASASQDVSTGDGSYAYLGDNFGYVSSQNGRVSRLGYVSGNQLDFNTSPFSEVTPTGASGQLFINPFAVDPSNEDIMYYLAGRSMWRNNNLSGIPDFEQGTSTGWTELTNLAVPDGYAISTLAVSRTPAHVLYYAASSDNDAPLIFRLNGSNTATSGATAIPIPNATAGAYVHSIAVNPNDANEIIVVFSNYNVVGLFHSTDGGQNYTAIEGNLTGDANNPGPSLRTASILPLSGETVYLVGTSTGAYSTSTLSSDNTVWQQQAATQLGNVVVEQITSRTSDGRIALGTHGRGIFLGTATASANAAPTFTATLPTQTVTVGQTLNFTYAASDSDGDALTFTLVTPPTGATINGTTGAFSWTPTADQVGSQTITVQVSDGTTSATATTTVTVQAANAAPTFTATLPDTSVVAGTALTFTYTASDPNGDALTFSLNNPPTGATIDANTGAFSWTPTAQQVGTATITVQVSDGSLSASTQATATVSAANAAPAFIATLPDTAVVAGTALTFTYTASDPNGDALTFSLSNAPAGATIDSSTGAFSWTPTAQQVGTATITVQVSDGSLSANTQATVTVTAGNAAPAFTATLSDTSVVAGTALTFTYAASDPNGDALTFSLNNAPTGATIDANTGAFSWTPTAEQAGTQTITVQVSDGSLSATTQATVTVTAANAAPAFTATLPDTSVVAGTALTFTYAASDPNGDALTFSLDNPPSGATIDGSTGVFSWTPTEQQVGTATITVQVSDGSLSASTQATVTITVGNAAPTFTATLPDTSVVAGTALTFTYAASDPNGDALTFSLDNPPSGATIDGSTGVFSWTPTEQQVGTATITVQVSDGSLSASTQATVTITASNAAPAFTTVLRDTTILAEKEFAFTYAAADPNGDAVTYTLINGPDGATLDGVTGVLSWMPTVAQEGNHVIRVEVSDGSLAAQTEATVSVTTANAAPVFAAVLPDTMITTGSTLNFTYQATDPNGDPVFYDILAGPNAAVLDENSGALMWSPAAADVGAHTIEVEAHDGDLGTVTTATVTVISGVANEQGEQPEGFTLLQNYPNPFNPSTSITFVLPEVSNVSLAVFDLNGRKVRDLLVGETKGVGRHTVLFDADGLASGTYGYTIRAEATTGTGRTFVRTMYMALVK